MLQSKITDIQLWHAVRMSNQAAFNSLFERYWIRLYKTAHYYLDDSEACAEIVNDVFVSIWKRRQELEIVSFAAFMQTSIRYQIYKHRKAVKLDIVFNETLITDIKHETNEGDTRIQQQEFYQEFHEYLGQLPKRCQEIFELSRIDCMTNQEIASKLNISTRTVENQLSLALKHLKRCFKNILLITCLLHFFK
jgi:RNA polymerase sigma-70 factor (family 1)